MDLSLGGGQSEGGVLVKWEFLRLLGESELGSSGLPDDITKTIKAIGVLGLS